MFLLIAISVISGIITSSFQLNTIEAKSNNTFNLVNTTAGGSTTVTVENFAFEPSILTVPNGTNITFDFQNGIHTVKTISASMADPITINNGGDFDPVGVGEQREVTINGQPGGVIHYQCGIHEALMSGTIRIEEGAIGEVGSDMLTITLEDWGGFIPIHEDRTYNSYSEVLTIASDEINRISIDKADSQIQDLKDNITANNYFGLNNEYGNPSDCCDIIHHTLSISMGKADGDQDSKTVYWNDAVDFPGALTKIASLIRNLH